MKKSIGIIRPWKQITPLTEHLMQACYARGLDACTYYILDIDMASATVPAQCWDGNQYVSCVTEIPPVSETLFIPGSAGMSERVGNELMDWLGNHTRFTDGPALSKEKLSQYLMMSELSSCAIPTYRVRTLSEIARYVSLFRRCILKPNGGRQGRAVLAVEEDDHGLVYSDGDAWRSLTPEAWTNYRSEYTEHYGVPLLQPRLNFTLNDGRAMDIRLLTARGGSGDWEMVKMYPRIGVNSVVSNISHGGEIGELLPILHQIAGEEAERIYAGLERLGREVPQLIEAVRPGAHSCFGIDVGIDRDSLQLYVIEANTQPQTKLYARELARVKAEYLAFLAEKL